MKKTPFGFLVLAGVVATTVSFMGACGGADSSSGSEATGGGAGEDSKGSGGKGTGGKGTGGKKGTGGSGEGGAPSDNCENVECPNDNNPCTEDVCNPETGKCGIPRTGTKCNDGLFCNGADKCDNGKCTDHAGSPCASGQACNEAEDACECTKDEHCPEEELGEWSEPTFDNVCDKTGAKSRTVTSYTCEQGMCKSSVTTENGSDDRETDGTECPNDDKFCNGLVGKCQNGSCVPTEINPCAGTSTPFCYEGNDTYSCRECEDDQAAGVTDDGCTSALPNCCFGTCRESSCVINLNLNITPINTNTNLSNVAPINNNLPIGNLPIGNISP